MNHLISTSFLLASVATAYSFAPARAAEITAKQENPATIRVIAPDAFELTFSMRKGFVASFFDLKNDPRKTHDLAPVNEENGILWTKAAPPGDADGGSWYANPPATMELLESGPVRVRIRLAGPHRRYGRTDDKAVWDDVKFEQIFTIYPTGNAYLDYTLVTQEPVLLHHFLLIIKSNGAWGNRGKGGGKDQVHCAGEFGADKPSGKQATSFALQWSDGPTHFQDFLMVLQKGRYSGSYWNEGYLDQDLRAGIDLMSRFPEKTVPKGKDHISVLFRFAHDLNSPEAAEPFAEDYRAPDRLEVTQGSLDTADEGDIDADGFNESQGCYVVKADARGAAFTLHGAKTPRLLPVFKIKGWTGVAPKTASLGKRELRAGSDFLASSQDGMLMIQLLENVRQDVMIQIPAPPR